MNQRGFATLEVILMIVVIGILATVAVPRFTDVTTKANTAKIQSDLTTIDSAIQIYYMEKGDYPERIDTDLKDYLMDIPTPPTGKAYAKDSNTATTSTELKITEKVYSINEDHRAILHSHVAGDFEMPKSSS